MLNILTNQVNHVKRYFQEWSYSMLKTIPHNFQSLEFVLFINSWYKKNPCSKHVQITLHKLWHFCIHLFSEVHKWLSRRVNKIKHNARVYSLRALPLEREGIHLIQLHHLRPVYTKRQCQRSDNWAMILVILLSLKTIELLEIGLQFHSEVTPLFSMRTVSLASW